jgi:ParB family chromosome partitioning protein
METVTINKIENVPFKSLVKDPNHPRQESGNLESLIASLRHDGLLTPITAVKVSDDKYHVADGWRRVEAAKAMGLKSISCYVYENMPEDEIAHKSYILTWTSQNQRVF